MITNQIPFDPFFCRLRQSYLHYILLLVLLVGLPVEAVYASGARFLGPPSGSLPTAGNNRRSIPKSGRSARSVTSVITAFSPAANARAAARTSPVAVTFDQPLTATSATALKVYSAQRGGLRTRGTTPAVVSGSTLTFTPTNYPYMPGETVYSTVTAAAQSSAGGPPTQPRVQQFTAAVGGTGRGTFVQASTVAVPNAPNGMAAGDVDGDGDLDLVAANTGTFTATVLLNNGSGTYAIASTMALPQRPFSLALGDVDGDGDLDAVMAVFGPGGSTVSTRLNGGDATGSGTGTFSNGSDLVVGDGPTFLALGDVDGDGDLDVAVTVNGTTNNGTTVRVGLNGGNSTGSNTGVFSSGSSVTVGPNAFALALGDVDNDGDLDIAASTDNGIKISLNTGTGTFGGGSTVALPPNPAQSVGLADLNADGYLDLFTETSVRLNTASGTGTFGSGSDPMTGGTLVVASDIDADGDLDLVAASDGTGGILGVKVRYNNGAGSFATGYDLPLGDQIFYVVAADVDGDGDLDVLTAAPKETISVRVLLNSGPPAPTITSFTPTSGPAGTTVTINGTNLTGTSVITFGGTGTTTVTTGFTVNAAGTQITGVIVPTGAQTGPISVTATAGTATSTASFTVPLPVLTGISPASGAVGTSVTLTGTNLAGAIRVSFNGTTTSTFTSNSATQLVLAVPGGATSGAVTVTTPAGTSNAVSFTVTCPVATVAYGTPSYCQTGATTLTPTLTGPTGGSFAAASGLTLNATTGAITPATSTPGTYTVTYSVGGTCPTAATASITITAAPVATFSYPTANTYCAGATGTVTPALGTGATAGTFSSTTGLTVNAATGVISLATSTAGTYTVTNTIAAANGCATAVATAVLTIQVRPATPVLTPTYNGANTTLTSSAPTGNQFYLNNAAIAGATGQTYVVNGTPAQLGSYTVTTTNANGCISLPSAALVVTSSVKPLAGSSLTVFPNPTPDGRLTVELTGYRQATELMVHNALGQVVFSTQLPGSPGKTVRSVNLSSLAAGVYLLRVQTEGSLDTRRLVKE